MEIFSPVSNLLPLEKDIFTITLCKFKKNILENISGIPKSVSLVKSRSALMFNSFVALSRQLTKSMFNETDNETLLKLADHDIGQLRSFLLG